MIHLTRLDGSDVVVNCELLEMVEHTPDTVISLLNGRKLVVRETVDEVVGRVIGYRQKSGVCAFIDGHIGGLAGATRAIQDSASGVNK